MCPPTVAVSVDTELDRVDTLFDSVVCVDCKDEMFPFTVENWVDMLDVIALSSFALVVASLVIDAWTAAILVSSVATQSDPLHLYGLLLSSESNQRSPVPLAVGASACRNVRAFWPTVVVKVDSVVAWLLVVVCNVLMLDSAVPTRVVRLDRFVDVVLVVD